MPHALTTVGQTRINELEGLEQPLIIDRMILALIPDQNPEDPVDRSQQMPDAEDIIYTHIIDEAHKGYITPDQVVYSMVLGSNIGDFSFNWIGTIEETTDTVISVITTPETPKWKTNIGENITGNIVTRNAMMSYQDAQNLTGITITAEWWQFDFQTLVADTVAARIVTHKMDQLDPTDTDEAKNKHLSNAQGKVWQDHLTDADIHETLKIESGSGVDGSLQEIPGRWKEMPAVGITSVRGLSTYDPAFAGVKQTLDYFIQDLEEYNPETDELLADSGYWRFILRAFVGAVSGSALFSTPTLNPINYLSPGFGTMVASGLSETQQTPNGCVSITPAGTANVTFSQDRPRNSFATCLWLSATLVIDGIGSYPLASGAISMGLLTYTGSITRSINIGTISVPSGQYSYHIEVVGTYLVNVDSGTNWVNVSASITGFDIYAEVPAASNSAAGLMGWEAKGLKGVE